MAPPFWYRSTVLARRVLARSVSRARVARAPRDPVKPAPFVSTGTDQTDYSSNALLDEWSIDDGAAGSDDGKEQRRPSRSEGEGRGVMARTDSIEKLRKLLKRRATAYISQREANLFYSNGIGPSAVAAAPAHVLLQRIEKSRARAISDMKLGIRPK